MGTRRISSQRQILQLIWGILINRVYTIRYEQLKVKGGKNVRNDTL